MSLGEFLPQGKIVCTQPVIQFDELRYFFFKRFDFSIHFETIE